MVKTIQQQPLTFANAAVLTTKENKCIFVDS